MEKFYLRYYGIIINYIKQDITSYLCDDRTLSESNLAMMMILSAEKYYI